MKAFLYKGLAAALLIALIGCEQGGTNRLNRQFQSSGIIPVSPGGRIAAVLTTGGPAASSASAYPGQQTQEVYPGQKDVSQPLQGQGNLSGGLAQCGKGTKGAIEILALFENELQVIGDDRSITNRFGRSHHTGGINGRTTGIRIATMGLSGEQSARKSQMKFSSEGSLVFVSLTDCDLVMGIPVYDNGGVGAAEFFDVGPKPSELAVSGDLLAVATADGVGFVRMDRTDIIGNARGRAFRQRVGRGQVNSVAFRYDEELVISYDRTVPGSRNIAGSEIASCDVPVMLGASRSPLDSFIGQGSIPGCSPLDTKHIQGIPVRLAVDDNATYFLDPFVGPCNILLPRESANNSFLPEGCFEQFSPQGGAGFLRRDRRGVNYTDIGIHPYGTVITTLNDQVTWYRTGNALDLGQSESRVFDEKLVALAIDPGHVGSSTAGEFALVAGQSKVFFLRLDEYGGVSSNGDVSDWIQLIGGTPRDLDIRPRYR